MCRAEPVDRAGLAVVAGEDAGMGTLGGGDRGVRRRDDVDQLRPADGLELCLAGSRPGLSLSADAGRIGRAAGSSRTEEMTTTRTMRRFGPSLEHHRAGSDEHRIGPGRVVALAGGDHEEDQDEEPGPGEDAVGAPFGIAPEVPDAGDPEVGRADAEQHDLQREEADALTDGAVLVPDLTRQRELWPAVVRLPEEHRGPRDGDGHARPEPGTAQDMSRRRSEDDA